MLDLIGSVIVDLEEAISVAGANEVYALRLRQIQGMLTELETDLINDIS